MSQHINLFTNAHSSQHTTASQAKYISHTRTVVPEYCKGDDASQWGKREIRPLATPKPPIVTKSCTRD